MSTEPGVPLAGRRLGEFVLGERLGEGGFGAVYLARQPALEREAVVKILHARLRSDARAVSLFMREARLAARLDHPYAAHIYAYGAEPDGVLWIAMELVRGTTLAEVIRAQGPVPLGRLAPFVEGLCEVVQSAHDKGIIHRDIKPANVMVLARGGRFMPKLLDLGIAKLSEDMRADRPPPRPLRPRVTDDMTEDLGDTGAALVDDTDARGVVGSPHFIAPEIWRGAVGDARVDVYALGVLLHECLTGRPPFGGATVAEIAQGHLDAPPPPLPPGLPAAVGEVVARALAKQPADRYATALELGAALRQAAGDDGPTLPRLNEEIAREWRQDGPRPLAEAVLLLEAARNPHQARDAALGLARALVHYVGVLCLACRGGRAADATELGPLLGELRRGRLSDEGWLELARVLCRPYAVHADSHPIPELPRVLGDDTGSLQTLLGELAARGQATPEAVAAQLGGLLGRLGDELRRFSHLLVYPLVVGRDGGAELWRGARPGGASRVAVEPGRAAILDGQGQLVASLWPFAQVAAPAPGLPDELFLYAGRGRGGALLVAHPHGFERHDEAPADLLATGDEGAALRLGEKAPYRGLSAFTADDADRFLGREREVVEVVNRLRVQPLLVVVGPSGAGKSSFVQAGVIPALPPSWRALTLRPGPSPMTALAQAVGVDAAELRADPASLADRLAGDATTVLVVDQLEELFTLCADPAEREAFAQAFAAAGARVDRPLRTVATLRDDFLVRLERLRALRGRISPALMLLTTPAHDDLRRILVTPARRAGYDFDDPELAREMVAAVADQPSALVLLSFTAARLWERRDVRERRLGRRAYEELGGVGGALARHAEEVLAALPAEERGLVRGCFRHLCTAEGTRAVLSRRELVALLGPQGDPLIDRLIEARLLASAQGDSGDDRVEVIHEALLSAWPRLVAWRQEDVAGSRLHEQLRAGARQWDERGRPRGLLWRDEALDEFRRWRVRYAGRLTDLEESFAAASLAEAARGRRARLRLVLGAFVALVAVVVVLIWQVRDAERARHAEEAAAAEARRTVAWQYEEQGRTALLDGRHLEALAYLSEAWRRGVDTRALRLLLAKAAQPLDKQLFLLEGHEDDVRTVELSPDGGRVLSASVDGGVRVWDARTGRPLLAFRAPAAARPIAVFSPDGTRIATGSLGGPAKLWDAATGAPLADLGQGRVVFGDGRALVFGAEGAHLVDGERLAGHTGPLTFGALLPGGRAVTGSQDGTIRVWRGGAAVLTLTCGGAVLSGAASPDGALVAAGSQDGTFCVFDAERGTLLSRQRGHARGVYTLQFSPDGSRVVTTGFDSAARVWEARTGRFGCSLEHEGEVTFARFSPDGARVATVSGDRAIGVWDAVSGKLLSRLVGHREAVHAAAFSPDGQRVASAGADRTVRLFTPRSDDLVTSLGGGRAVYVSRFLPGGRLLTSSEDSTLRVWDIARGELVASRTSYAPKPPTVIDQGFDARAVAASADGRIVAAADEGEVRVFGEGGELARLGGHEGRVWAVAVSPDGTRVATGDDRDVRVFEATGRLLRTLRGHTEPIESLAFSPDGVRLVSASDDDTARVWDGDRQVVLRGHARDVVSATPAPGDQVVTASMDATVRVWDGTTGALLRTLVGHRGNVRAAEMSPDRAFIVSAGDDETVKLWDAATGKLLYSFGLHGAAVWDARFSADGKRLATASEDGTAKIWSVEEDPRSAAAIVEATRCRVPYQIVDGRLVDAPRPGQAAASLCR